MTKWHTRDEWKLARIAKQYNFSAAHFLTGVPDSHPCAKLHGHNYIVEIQVRGDVSPMTGMLIDYYEIDKAMKPIIAKLDHICLNDIIENPTAERIAHWIMEEYSVKYLWSVKVYETPKTWAEVVNHEGFWNAKDRAE
jgi:6-pyruvoyltetrahydropterin/6-carboxytetrahydropterin synthase